MKHVSRDLSLKSILSVAGAFAAISVRGEGILHADIISPLDSAGVVVVRPWGTTTNRRLNLTEIVSASAASVSSRAEMRAIVERQRAEERRRDPTASPLPVDVKLDLILNVAGEGRGRREHWRGTIIRLANDLIEFAPLGCDGRTVEFCRDQVMTWRPARGDHGRSDHERARANRARLGLPDDRSRT